MGFTVQGLGFGVRCRLWVSGSGVLSLGVPGMPASVSSCQGADWEVHELCILALDARVIRGSEAALRSRFGLGYCGHGETVQEVGLQIPAALYFMVYHGSPTTPAPPPPR